MKIRNTISLGMALVALLGASVGNRLNAQVVNPVEIVAVQPNSPNNVTVKLNAIQVKLDMKSSNQLKGDPAPG